MAQKKTSLALATGIAGLAGVVLLFGPIIAVSTQGEPPFDGTRDEVATFFGNAAAVGWYQTAEALEAIGMLALLWFFVGLASLLRPIEGPPAWRSTVALLSGTLLVAYGNVDVSWQAAINRATGTDPGVGLYAFDVGNIGFSNAWLSMASFALAFGWVLLESRALPRWLGWSAVVSGAGLVVARFAWESPLWMIPYALFWVWVIALAVRLVRRRHLVPDTVLEATQG
jgi:hypothetical protein